MNRLILAFCLLVASVASAAAQGPYVGVSGGVSIVHESDVVLEGEGSWELEYDTGYGLNVAAGYNVNPFRVEAEFGYKTADLDNENVDLSVFSYMVNGYYDLKVEGPVTPFFGAGIGIINGEIDDDYDDTVFGYQLSAGLSAAVNKNVNFDLYYRFQGAGSDFEERGLKVSYDSSNIFLGMRYNF